MAYRAKEWLFLFLFSLKERTGKQTGSGFWCDIRIHVGRLERVLGNNHVPGEATGVAGEVERRLRSPVSLAGLGEGRLRSSECGVSDQEKDR